jgi:hypothetical protein
LYPFIFGVYKFWRAKTGVMAREVVCIIAYHPCHTVQVT